MKYKKDTTIKRILFCFYILNAIKSNGVFIPFSSTNQTLSVSQKTDNCRYNDLKGINRFRVTQKIFVCLQWFSAWLYYLI
jgi:hypothetical protein